ncbi:MAG: bifunctional folylpolyglutamate synthase/dihydrofolate synthase [Bacteroidetes bacterium]|nr:bifunctional folylpolyglutamate synthase/dihydrofolate synthase [Bacteroidota bacterium]MCL5025689.1 bifunctional folylpolyglutamate synthase/dihydrofolate synthase [Chloroflexota bacterium]
MLTYGEALDYILGLANYETSVDSVAAAARFNLDTVRHLARLAGWQGGRYIHIAGTKGKGSTAAMVDSLLREAGYRTGLFTSPHLHCFRERIRVDGRLIPERAVARLAWQLRPLVAELQRDNPQLSPVTTFDFLVVMALSYFSLTKADFGVLETGLGGRLDATNVVTPLVSVITSISYDHTQILGDTLDQIAAEKAGIIKPNGVVVVAPQEGEALAVLEATARERNARIVRVDRDYRWRQGANGLDVEGPYGAYTGLQLPLLGDHQQVNAVTAIATLDMLRQLGFALPAEAVRRGIARVRWPGRLEVLRRRPLIITDGAHNADSAQKLATALQESFAYRRLFLILGTSSDKDIAGIVRALAPLAGRVIVARSQHPRAASYEAIEGEVRRYTDCVSRAGSVAEAIAAARSEAGSHDLICSTGSLFVAAETREALGFRSIYRSYRPCTR